MDPGAEPGWAVLSDTLPSAGEQKKVHILIKRFSQKCFDDNTRYKKVKCPRQKTLNSK